MTAVRAPAPKQLTVLTLVGATYFMVAGGPYGLEQLLAGGYGVAIAVLLITPFVWAAPIAWMSAELGSAIPDQGGHYAWVRRGLGPFWGIWEALVALLASIVDMALYPTLFAFYVSRLVPMLGEHSILLGIIMIAFCTIWNLLGSRSVGWSSVVFFFVTIAPFVVLCALGFGGSGSHEPAPVAAVPPTVDGVMDGVLVAMWSFSGWDCSTTVADEVRRPAQTIPRALFLSLLLVTLTYLAPVIAMRYARVSTEWNDGAWVDAAKILGGPLLAASLAICGALASAGMFTSLVLSYSRLPVALADDGYLPAIFGRRSSRTGAPWLAIILCSVTYCAVLALGFKRLLQLDILFYGVCLLSEFAALVALRIREPNLNRPLRIPGGTPGVVLLSLVPLALAGIAITRAPYEAVWSVGVLRIGIALIGVIGVVSVFLLSRSRWAIRIVDRKGVGRP